MQKLIPAIHVQFSLETNHNESATGVETCCRLSALWMCSTKMTLLLISTKNLKSQRGSMLQHQNEIIKFRIETCWKNLRQNNEKGVMVATWKWNHQTCFILSEKTWGKTYRFFSILQHVGRFLYIWFQFWNKPLSNMKKIYHFNLLPSRLW